MNFCSRTLITKINKYSVTSKVCLNFIGSSHGGGGMGIASINSPPPYKFKGVTLIPEPP